MKVRTLSAHDAPRVALLNTQLGYVGDVDLVRRRLEVVTSKSDHWVLGADGAGDLLGFIHFFERPSVDKGFDVVVQSLVVDEKHRGTGVGRVLMDAAEATAKANGITSIALSSRVDRLDAHAFYVALGYAISATSNVFVKWLD